MSTVQVVSITDLDQLSQLGNNDYLLVYDLTESTWKRIEKNNIQLDVATHNNSMHTENYLITSSNLSDLDDVATARANLGLNNTLNRNNNLADLTNVDDARSNLGLNNINIRTQGNYEVLDTDTTLEVGKKYIIREDVTATLPATVSIGNEIEIVCGDMFDDTSTLDSFIDPNGNNIEGDSSLFQMTSESFRLVYTGSPYGWSRI